jgi:hypothetical protein
VQALAGDGATRQAPGWLAAHSTCEIQVARRDAAELQLNWPAHHPPPHTPHFSSSTGPESVSPHSPPPSATECHHQPMQTALQGMRACRACRGLRLPIATPLLRCSQQLVPLCGGASSAAAPARSGAVRCSSSAAAAAAASATEAAAAPPTAAAADSASAPAPPQSTARERREFKPRSSIKDLLVSLCRGGWQVVLPGDACSALRTSRPAVVVATLMMPLDAPLHSLVSRTRAAEAAAGQQ